VDRLVRSETEMPKVLEYLGTSSMEPGLHGPDRTIDSQGDFLVGLASFVEQDKDFTVVLP
jgi:hypothetical protein